MTDSENGIIKGNPDTGDTTSETSEQVSKRALMLKVAKMYGLTGELATQRVDYMIINLDTLKKLAESVGYFYGIPPHRMPPELIEQLIKLGEKFLQGSRYDGNSRKYLDVGLDIFKTISAESSSQEYQEWDSYVSNKVASR